MPNIVDIAGPNAKKAYPLDLEQVAAIYLPSEHRRMTGWNEYEDYGPVILLMLNGTQNSLNMRESDISARHILQLAETAGFPLADLSPLTSKVVKSLEYSKALVSPKMLDYIYSISCGGRGEDFMGAPSFTADIQKYNDKLVQADENIWLNANDMTYVFAANRIIVRFNNGAKAELFSPAHPLADNREKITNDFVKEIASLNKNLIPLPDADNALYFNPQRISYFAEDTSAFKNKVSLRVGFNDSSAVCPDFLSQQQRRQAENFLEKLGVKDFSRPLQI